MDQIKISLIIPCYNVPEEQIRRAFSSISRQSFSGYEVIVVDDGSKEEYAAILGGLCEKSDQIILIRTENQGVSAARNTGITHAHGDYIAFLDADDVLAEDFMVRAWQAVSETNADFVIGGITILKDVDTFQPAQRTKPLPYEVYTPSTSDQLLHYLIGPRVVRRFPDGQIGRGPWARLVRTELVKAIPFDEELRIGEDVNWNVQLLARCRTACLVSESWYGYWKNPNSVMNRYDPKFIFEIGNAFNKLSRLIDLTDHSVYADYAFTILSSIKLYWRNTLRFDRTSNRALYRKTVRYLYSEPPWSEIGSCRFFRSFNGKKKLVSLLYKLRLYFFIKALAERF